ncbi:MAG: tetratricopeptide repeat protein, partial [Prochlorothrix sp.]
MLLNLKVIYIKTGSLAPALRTVEQLLLLDPQRPQEHRDRGLLLYELERWQEAYPALE